MKLVIDISEEDYKSACKREFSMDGSMMIYNAIREGTEYKEQPHGEWVEGFTGYFETLYCDKCGYAKPSRHYEFNFCPNCGARMKEGEAE